MVCLYGNATVRWIHAAIGSAGHMNALATGQYIHSVAVSSAVVLGMSAVQSSASIFVTDRMDDVWGVGLDTAEAQQAHKLLKGKARFFTNAICELSDSVHRPSSSSDCKP